MAEQVEFPLKPWQKAILNALIVAMISMFSTLTVAEEINIKLLISVLIAGGLTLLVQMQVLLKKDLEDDSGKSYTPLMFFKW